MMDPEESARILYGTFSPRDVPRYTVAQASRYVGLSPTTLRSWVRGRSYLLRGGQSGRSEPLIRASDLLSFSNLVEAHILRALRRDEDVRMSFLRTALTQAEREFQIERLLLSEQLRFAAGEVLLEYYGKLINLGRAGQLAMRHFFEAHLKRVDFDAQGPTQFFPGFVSVLTLPAQEIPRLIVIDPSVSFGKPVLASRRGIRVSAIVSRVDAGEDEDEIAQDYGIERREVDAAIDFYERAA